MQAFLVFVAATSSVTQMHVFDFATRRLYSSGVAVAKLLRKLLHGSRFLWQHFVGHPSPLGMGRRSTHWHSEYPSKHPDARLHHDWNKKAFVGNYSVS